MGILMICFLEDISDWTRGPLYGLFFRGNTGLEQWDFLWSVFE